jgi:hypothetical protein
VEHKKYGSGMLNKRGDIESVGTGTETATPILDRL